GVAGVCASFGMGVGGKVDARIGAWSSLAEVWNGSTWSVVPSPNAGPSFQGFKAVSCVSATFCAAVGNYYTANFATLRTLTELWDGTAWSIVPSPSPGANDPLLGVSCISPTSCF